MSTFEQEAFAILTSAGRNYEAFHESAMRWKKAFNIRHIRSKKYTLFDDCLARFEVQTDDVRAKFYCYIDRQPGKEHYSKRWTVRIESNRSDALESLLPYLRASGLEVCLKGI